jgi:hypothetical protein
MSLQRSSNISLASQMVSDEIAVAREMAASSNRVVEIRFVTPTNWAALGTPAYTGFHAIQLWAPNESGVSAPVDNMVTLPDSIEISSNSSLSPLLSTLVGSSNAMPAGTTAGSYVSCSVRPAGNVQVAHPPANTSGTTQDDANVRAPSYFLTILPVLADGAAQLPKNYATLQVNPDTGRTQTYRP